MGLHRPLPEGRVTFLLTDIEGSTRLWEAHPEPMRAALARHDALAAAALTEHRGSLVKSRGEGDSLFAVFASAADALAAACSLQQALLAEAWPPETPLRVRVALHSGAADHRGGDYYGPAVNRCARLRAVAHGGQVLLSQATRDLAGGALPEGASLRDLGLHRLKDLQQPEHLFQLLHPALPAEFPPLRSLEAFRHNLPAQLTRFIGREQQIAEVKGLLSGTRLLTLTGAGGCGKTRLALQVAADLIEEHADGVWLVELAALADPDLVPQAVATALGVREEPGRALVDTLQDYLRSRTLLLVLDNCEHLLGMCAQLAERLLRRCPNLRIVTSSREGLGITGEQTYRVPSLSLPEERPTTNDQRRTTEGVLQYEAVQLFVDRALLGQPRFAITPENAGAVTQVCRRLDGIPLAIELAAARVKALPVEQIAARLDDRFRLLTEGSRTALPRQQTLRALIDWSYDLLSEKERALLRRLSVFAGGWTLEAAEAVCAGEGVEAWEVFDLLAALVEKSLVVYEGQEEARYHLLETVRQYARDRLVEAGEAAGMRGQHCDWFLALAEQKSQGENETAWMDRLEREHDNLRVALAWSGAQGQGEMGLRLGGALAWFWRMRGYWREGREHLAELLALPGAEGRTEARATALSGAGVLECVQGNLEAARALHEESLAISRELGNKRETAWSIWCLGLVDRFRGEYEAARKHFEESLAIFRQLDCKEGIAHSLDNLGIVTHHQGHYEAARALLGESLAIHRTLDNKHGIGWSLHSLGKVALDQGNYGTGRPLFEESLVIQRELGEKDGIVLDLEGLAALAVAQAQPQRAARLFGAAEGLRESIGAPLHPAERANHDRHVAAARSAVSEEAFAAAWAAGRAMSLDEAIAYALEET